MLHHVKGNALFSLDFISVFLIVSIFFFVVVVVVVLDGVCSGQLQFNEIRERILRLGIEMATSAQRDRFVENPVDQVRAVNHHKFTEFVHSLQSINPFFTSPRFV